MQHETVPLVKPSQTGGHVVTWGTAQTHEAVDVGWMTLLDETAHYLVVDPTIELHGRSIG